jgi:hypothetical protein
MGQRRLPGCWAYPTWDVAALLSREVESGSCLSLPEIPYPVVLSAARVPASRDESKSKDPGGVSPAIQLQGVLLKTFFAEPGISVIATSVKRARLFKARSRPLWVWK